MQWDTIITIKYNHAKAEYRKIYNRCMCMVKNVHLQAARFHRAYECLLILSGCWWLGAYFWFSLLPVFLCRFPTSWILVFCLSHFACYIFNEIVTFNFCSTLTLSQTRTFLILGKDTAINRDYSRKMCLF